MDTIVNKPIGRPKGTTGTSNLPNKIRFLTKRNEKLKQKYKQVTTELRQTVKTQRWKMDVLEADLRILQEQYDKDILELTKHMNVSWFNFLRYLQYYEKTGEFVNGMAWLFDKESDFDAGQYQRELIEKKGQVDYNKTRRVLYE